MAGCGAWTVAGFGAAAGNDVKARPGPWTGVETTGLVGTWAGTGAEELARAGN